MFIIIIETHAKRFTRISLIFKSSMRSDYDAHFIGEEMEPLRGCRMTQSHSNYNKWESPHLNPGPCDPKPVLKPRYVSWWGKQKWQDTEGSAHSTSGRARDLRASQEGLGRGGTGKVLGAETGA